MEIRHLHSFVVAAETESFTRAAEVVGLTQSAVSPHIASLEKRLGRSLFDRGANSIHLTEFGKILYQHARRIMVIVDVIKQEAGQKSTTFAGLVTFASSSVPAEWLLPEIQLAIRAAVECNVGVSFLSLRAIQRELDDARLVRVDISGMKIIRSLYLVTDPGRLPNTTVRAVLSLVDDYRKTLLS